eukprot:superscaffoldBa00006707_g21821
MPAHRRGRSLSDALTLEQSDEGGLVISSINNSASAGQGLREGDEIVGATIDFDQLSKQEVLEVLKLMKPFDDKVRVLTKNNLSKSLGNLDESSRSPETMLKDSYSKLYNAKIKKFMKDDLPYAENEEVTAKPTVKHDMELPRLGVDFGHLKTKTPNTDFDAESQSGDATFSADTAGELTDGNNLNLPPLGLGSNDPVLRGGQVKVGSRVQVPTLNVNARSSQLNGPEFHLSGTLPESPDVNTTTGIQLPNTDSPSVDLTMPNHERPQIGLKNNGSFTAPQIGIDLKGLDVSNPDTGINLNGGNITGVPKVGIEGTNKRLKMPKFKLPDLGLTEPALGGPECEVGTPDIEAPDVPTGKIRHKYSKRLKYPDLNVDNPSGYVQSPKLSLSGKSPDFGLETPGMNVSQPDLNGPANDFPSSEVKGLLKKPKIDLKAPYLDVDAPSGKFSMSKFGLSGKSDADVKTPDLSLKMPKIKGEIKAPDINPAKADPSGKYKAPKFTMPRFDLPNIEIPGFNGDLEGQDVQLAAPELKPGIADPNFDLNVPSTDLDISSPSGKLKMPGFGLSGPKVKGPDYHIKTPDLDLSAPKFKEGMHLPGIDLKDPKVGLNNPDVDINIPSGKLDTDAPSGKFKLPKFKLFGTLPKKKDVDINAGLKTPELTLKSPKMKGMDSPDLSVPKMDFKVPNLDLHSPEVNIDSPKGKFTLPKLKKNQFNLSGPKRPNIDVDGSLNRPDLPSGGLDMNLSKPQFDFDAPSLDFKGPNSELKIPDANIGRPSGKIKMPNFEMPDFGLSGPNLRGLNGKLGTPDFDLSAPKFKGAIGSPSLNLPEMDQPKLDLTGPDVNLDMPSGQFKVPAMKEPNIDLNVPDMHIDAPTGKFRMPKLDLSGTLPKGPNMAINTDLKSPDFSVEAPKINGGIDTPDLDLPNMDLKAPKLDMNTPDVNIGSPKTKFKMPKLKMPKFSLPSLKGPEMDGNLDGPDVDVNVPNINLKGPKADLGMPDVDIAGPSGKFKKPNLNLPDLGLSGPKLDGHYLDLKSPDLDFSGPNLSGGINVPDLNMPKFASSFSSESALPSNLLLPTNLVDPSRSKRPPPPPDCSLPVLRTCDAVVPSHLTPVPTWVETLEKQDSEPLGVAHLHPDVFAVAPRGPTSYYYMLPMKVRVQGLKVALSSKMAQDYLHIVDSLNIPTPDPQYLLDLIKQRHWGSSVLIVDVAEEFPENILQATANLKSVNVIPAI